MRFAVAAVASALALTGCGASEPESRRTPALPAGPALALERVATGLASPVQALTVPSESARLYVVELGGRVRVLEHGRRRTFLDLRERLSTGGERGLFALTFHPRYPQVPFVYASYTDRAGDSRVTEFRVGGRGAVRVRDLLRVEQPYENHNGGQIAFGPDRKLYLALGDGGAAFDPERRAQSRRTFLGKLLRLDVDRRGARWELIGLGLRNPWRFAFDEATGDLWIGDVGQDLWEEVNVVRAGTGGVTNFGWDVYEGRERVEDGRPAARTRLVWPVAVYAHDVGCSITGGLVYRGRRIQALRGRYVYGDFCTGAVFSLRASDGGGVRREQPVVGSLVGFGEDAASELLLVSAEGTIFRLVDAG